MAKYRIIQVDPTTFNVENFAMGGWVIHFRASTFAKANAWLAKQYARIAR